MKTISLQPELPVPLAILLSAVCHCGHLPIARAEPLIQRDVASPSAHVDTDSRRPNFKSVKIAAHRGGYESDKADNAPENSVANIRNCQTKGYELYETDVQRTKDGRFVIMHDATIERETTGVGPVRDWTLADLKKLYKRFRDGSVSKHRVATLDEFLVEGRGRVVFKVDLKPGVNKYFKEILETIVKYKAMEGIVFRVDYRDAELYARYRSDGVPFHRGLLMFMVTQKEQVDDIKKRFDPSTIQVNLDNDDPTRPETLELISYATRRGLIVEVHAEGTEQDWKKLVEAGARMFHTSKPAKTRAFLRQAAMQR